MRASEEGREATPKQLNEIEHLIATGGEAANEAVGLIEKLFSTTEPVPISDSVKARDADRTIAEVVPSYRQMNGIGDAMIIEAYVEALAGRDDDYVFASVTHNIRAWQRQSSPLDLLRVGND